MVLLAEMRYKIEADQFEFSKHAVDQTIIRRISVHEVRVNEETGEQHFSPVTVERLHRAILGHENPSRFIETPVYEYAE